MIRVVRSRSRSKGRSNCDRSFSPISAGSFDDFRERKSDVRLDTCRDRSRSRGRIRSCERIRGRSRSSGGSRNRSRDRGRHHERSRKRSRTHESIHEQRSHHKIRKRSRSMDNYKTGHAKSSTVDRKIRDKRSRSDDSCKIVESNNFVGTTGKLSPDSSGIRKGRNDDRLGRLEMMVELLVSGRQKTSNNNVPKDYKLHDHDNIPEFIPRNSNFTTSMWLNRIQEESMNKNFDEKSTIQFMQSKMTGIVKAWFKTVSSYDFTWPELKLLIIKTFPDNIDFAKTLKLLVERQKQLDETITQYYFCKMYLIEACKITGSNAVSCLIDGLIDPFLQADAKSHNCLTPESLYSVFLSKLPDRGPSDQNSKAREVVEYLEVYETEDDADLDPNPRMSDSKLFDVDRRTTRCYNCSKLGHTAATCTLPQICYKCSKPGHRAAQCHAYGSRWDHEGATQPKF